MVFFTLFQIYSVICLIGKSLSGSIRCESQIMRILCGERCSGYILHARCLFAILTNRFPCITIIIHCIKFAGCSKGFFRFKRTILDHFCIKPAICSKVNVLKKETDHFRRNTFPIFTCNLHSAFYNSFSHHFFFGQWDTFATARSST